MDITEFFKPKKKKGKSKKKSKSKKESSLKKSLTLGEKYTELINHFRETDVIDLLEYSHLINFYKNKGHIVNLNRFIEIWNKVDASDKIDQSKKKDFIKVSDACFSHVLEEKNGNIKKLNSVDTSEKMFNEKKEHFTFSSDQKTATNEIISFLLSPEEKSYGLYGYAGTGKTTLIVELTHFLLKNNYIRSVVLAAPTNKAVNIMKAKFRYELKSLIQNKTNKYKKKDNFDDQLDKLENIGIKVDFITIHKLLNYQNEFDVEGNRVFIKGSKSSIMNYDLVLIDECSMIPIDLINSILEDIRKETEKQKKDRVSRKIPKVIFVGDPAQLPPVNEKVSIIFGKNDKHFDFIDFKKSVPLGYDEDGNIKISDHAEKELTSKFNRMKSDIINQRSYTLTDVVRSKDDKVVGLCNNIRKWVIDSDKIPKMGKYKGKTVYIYKYDRRGKKNTQWIEKFLQYTKTTNKETESNIILTWTNRQTDEYNSHVRDTLFNTDERNKKKFVKGDILILSDFYNIDESEVYDMKDDKKRFHTSEQVKVADLDETIRACGTFREALPPKTKKLKNRLVIEKKYREVTHLMNTKTTRKFRVWKLHTHRLQETVKDSIPDVYQMYVVKDEDADKLEKEKEFCIEKIKQLRQFYRVYYKDQINQIDMGLIKPLWKEMNKIFIDPFANVNYGISLSVHKSQGSTFYNVFVDADDILNNRRSNEARRCVYTALTRASNEIHILI